MAPAPKPKRWRRWWRPVRLVLSLVLLGVAVWVVLGKSSELSGASAFLTQLRWQWLAIGALVEFFSYVGLAQLQRALLWAGGVRAGLARTILIIFSGSAIQAALPAGAAFAGVFEFRQYQSLGADDILAGFVVVGSAVVAFATLATLAGVGLAMAASAGSAEDLAEAIVGVLCLAVVVAIVARRDGVFALVLRAVGRAEKLLRRPEGCWAEDVAAAAHRLRAVAPRPAVLSMAAAASVSSWLADCGCLAAAYLAVGASVPWLGLLLAYCGGQLAVNLPITPGGLGVVEGSLTVALVSFGGGQAATVAAVLLYRVMSFWAPLPVGGATYLALVQIRRREGKKERPAQALPAGHDHEQDHDQQDHDQQDLEHQDLEHQDLEHQDLEHQDHREQEREQPRGPAGRAGTAPVTGIQHAGAGAPLADQEKGA